ncbi:MAG: hypothetical protein Q9199_005220 [Rusavskia elegans]
MDIPKFVREVLDGEKVAKYRMGGYHPTHIGDTYKQGRYKILHKLGSGGYGTVWLARDTEAKRYVALKIIVANDKSGKLELKWFKYLARQQSKHPGKQHLLMLLDHFKLSGPHGIHTCLVLPFLGPCVRHHAASYISGILDHRIARRVATQLSESLVYLHSLGIGHGDCHTKNIVFRLQGIEAWTEDDIYEVFGRPRCQFIEENCLCQACMKSANYIVQPIDMSRMDSKYISDDIVLIDYGLSFRLDNPPSWIGTITNYLAPEIVFECQVSKASDIWALGCVIYELFTGLPLFEHDQSVHKVLAQMVPILGLFPSKWWRWDTRSECLGPNQFHDIWKQNDEPVLSTSVSINALDTRIRSKRKFRINDISLLALNPSPHLQLSNRGAAALAELLGSMLCYTSHRRISADQVLQHRFLRPDCVRMFKC